MARVCVVGEFSFPLDGRARREVLALASAGHEVDVVCMRRAGEAARERDGNVSILRLPIRRHRGGLSHQLYEYSAFALLAGLVLAGRSLRRRYDLVQVNTSPDWLVLSAIVPKLCGTAVLVDLEECMPEFFASRFGTGEKHPGVRLMALIERAAIRIADAAFTCTEQMREAFLSRGAPPAKIGVVLNSADETAFDPTRRAQRVHKPGQFTLISHGTIEERYGLDTAIRAVARLRDVIPELALKIYGEGSDRERLVALVAELALESHVEFSDGFVPLDELVNALAAADAGLVATKCDPFRELVHCEKMYDFIAMRRPVICSRTRSVLAYFPEDCFAYFDSDDDAGLAHAIRELHDEPQRAERLVERAAAVIEPRRWARVQQQYLELVASLIRQ
ncbi:MAG: glycosyltransferase family 4 protein [Solirubrobacteraceae bacterium]